MRFVALHGRNWAADSNNDRYRARSADCLEPPRIEMARICFNQTRIRTWPSTDCSRSFPIVVRAPGSGIRSRYVWKLWRFCNYGMNGIERSEANELRSQCVVSSSLARVRILSQQEFYELCANSCREFRGSRFF